MDTLNRFLTQLSQRQDLVFVLLFSMVVAMLVIPLPTVLIDILLAINITLSIVILMVALYLKNVLDLSTFPAIILVSTIFRLALTVSTTRLILAQGDAGKIIAAFGNFVVGGNLVVGLVIFFIVAIVQFIVVTKGAERIAEVSARFTLDALPGKQMAIDADVRAGDTTKEEAKKRRFILEKESQLFGSMDGAMRFVKGDAIASLVIVFVNLFGGMLIGTLQAGMPFREAIKLYALLSVGDGLVAQIPSMLIAVAAGAVVTRVVTEDSVNLGEDIGRQLGSEPKSLGIAGALSACLAFVPGFPSVVFLVLAAFLGGLAWMLIRKKKDSALAAERKTQTDADEANDENLRPPEEFEAPEARTLFALVGSQALKDELTQLRFANALNKSTAEVAVKTGFPIRNPAFIVNNDVEGLEIRVEGLRVKSLNREECTDIPATIDKIASVLHVNNAKAFDGDIASLWMGWLKETFPRAISEIEQSVRVLYVVDVVRDLLSDNLTIAQPRPVLEALMRAKDLGHSAEATADLARSYMKIKLTVDSRTPSGELPVIIVDFAFENHIRQLLQRINDAPALAVRDPLVSEAVAQLRNLLSEAGKDGLKPVVICQNDVRRPIRTLLRALQLNTTVIGLTEIDPGVALKTVGVIGKTGSAAGQTAQMPGFNPAGNTMAGFPPPAFAPAFPQR